MDNRSNPYDPKPVIEFAALRAKELNRVTYVRVDWDKFTYTTMQPKVGRSHWKVEPDGKLFAHLAEPNLEEYKYEEL